MASTLANEDLIYSFFKSFDFSDAGIAGILGNWRVESSFDPTRPNPREGAIGFGQWEGGRRTALQHYAAARGSTETDPYMQLGYTMYELQHGYSGVLNAVQHATDPSAAAAYWDANYEVSSGSARQERMNYAQTYYQQIQSGGLKQVPVKGGGLGRVDKHPPLNPDSLHVPLTLQQRHTIINYIGKRGWTPDMQASREDYAIGVVIGEPAPVAGWGPIKDQVYKAVFLDGKYDASMITQYKKYVQGLYTVPADSQPGQEKNGHIWDGLFSGVKAIIGFFTITNLKRVGLFVLGAMLVTFAAYEIFREEA